MEVETEVQLETGSGVTSKYLRINQYLEKSGLTKAEVPVAMGLCQGKNNLEIADDLELSDKTVKFHITHIHKKLDVKSRLECVVKIFNSAL